jgi:hypothetical protein
LCYPKFPGTKALQDTVIGFRDETQTDVHNIPAHTMCKESIKMVANETVFLTLTDNSKKAGSVYINVTMRY